MSNTRYRRGKLYAADMAVYSRQMSADNSREISRLRHNLIRALREDVTEKQRTALLLYYAEGYNMREIGEQMGVDKSTVSRTIKRGERRLQRCLRYGAAHLLDELREAPRWKKPVHGTRRGRTCSTRRFWEIFVPRGGPPCWMVSFALGWRRQLTVVRKAFIIDATTKFDQKGP